MDIIDHYTEISKKEVMNVKEVKDFSEKLESELLYVTNLKYGRSMIQKIIHPIVTVKNNRNYKRLNILKEKFDSFVNSDVLQYVDEETGELATDLDYAARHTKPTMAKEFVKSLDFKVKHNYRIIKY